MPELTTRIGAYDAEKRTVSVTFTSGDIVHEREVNACLTNGEYDEEATNARVADVARGVVAKIAVGAITQASEQEG